MPIELPSRLKNAWNAFINNKDPTKNNKDYEIGYGYSYRPDRHRITQGVERSIVNAVYNRIAMDVAANDIRHVRLDENDRYLETIDSDLNECLSVEANIDQTGRSFIQDVVMSMFDEGCIAVIPVDTDTDPDETGSVKIYSMRTAKIMSWKPRSIHVRAYNDRTGHQEELDVLKCNTLIIENPLYSVINEPNSTMQRLIRKLALLDSVDEQSSAGKLDLIIQLPYTVRSELRKQQAMDRKKQIEEQLANSKYGIAYIDSTEHITQLNRAVENNLMSQIEYLTNMVYSQLGLTAEILNGTADEKTMLNYNSRTIEPILSAITDEMTRKWLTKTARSQKQAIMFFHDPFKLVPISNIADIADKFTRNEIMTSNEIRQIVGMKKSNDPNADQLRNKNLNQSTAEVMENPEGADINGEMPIDPQAETQGDYDSAMAELDSLDEELNKLDQKLAHANLGLSEDDVIGLMAAEDFDDWLAHYANPYYDPVKAHEYYEKHKHLKGRKSTASLNDEGKEIAAQLKSNINAEREKKQNENTSSTNSAIASSQSRTNASIQNLNSQRSQQLTESKEAMQKKISDFKEYTASLKERHTNALKSRINSLQSLVSVKGRTPEEKAKLRNDIDKLRAENQTKRAELQSKFQQVSNSARSEHQSTASKLKEENSKSVSALRESNKSETSKLRSELKDTNKKLKEEYDQKYTDAINDLVDSGEYDKKTKSSSASGSSGSGKKVGYWTYQKKKNSK